MVGILVTLFVYACDEVVGQRAIIATSVKDCDVLRKKDSGRCFAECDEEECQKVLLCYSKLLTHL